MKQIVTDFILTIWYNLTCYFRQEEGVAATEAALLMPFMITMLLGTYDVGRGVLINQKVITSSQICADLIARNLSVGSSDIDESIEAARLSLEPFDNASFGIDIVSLRFDEYQNAEVLWRETRNMAPNSTAVTSTEGIFREGEGVIIVTVRFEYTPEFAGSFLNPIQMQEIAFARGRRSPTVPMS